MEKDTIHEEETEVIRRRPMHVRSSTSIPEGLILDDVEKDTSVREDKHKENPSPVRPSKHKRGLDSGWSSFDDTYLEEEIPKEQPLFSRLFKPKLDEDYQEAVSSLELVDNERLNEMWAKTKENEKEKRKVFELCDNTCSNIMKRHSGKVLSVLPAYDPIDKNNIVFVLITKEPIDETELDLEYSTVIRPKNTYSEEAALVMMSKENNEHRLSFKESENIRQAINNKAKELMQCHKNLSVISGSGVRSKNFKQGKPEIIQEACIVLYVHTKGKIPLDETEFPKELDGIPVDVREGEFQRCVSAKEYQHTLQMGCQIESGKIGTLGGFVDHPEYGLSAITCAHVVLDDEELHDLRRNSKKTWRCNEKPIYQPDISDKVRNYCGQLKEAIYKSGTGDNSGVDLAVFQIEKRAPESGTFPDVNSTTTDMVFETGKLCSSVNENFNYVMKFGCTTNKTEGFVQFSSSAVRLIEHTHTYRVSSKDYTYSLFNQFEIRPILNQHKFVQPGDSGSLVFKEDISRDLLCIGMVVGVFEPCGNGIVIPISAIKAELGVSELKNFSWNLFKRMDSRLAKIENQLQTLHSLLSR
ncbi:uncharacterized protein LOC123549841 isoform X2 [Mercenaria mercenaria]|uniref:uncharacterized protein LOC123549841 isoform X2 n=1 Tax=Mercenaria mercenaria TaxID=6596 RepID=UPI00234EF3E8|nr:uncharacterized protein LOC123549841 isoform X2 [Mercenaria mercenaria]